MKVANETRIQTPTDTTPLHPVQEVARFLSLSRAKIYQLMTAGELPYVKLGKSRRVRWGDVLKLVDRNTHGRIEA